MERRIETPVRLSSGRRLSFSPGHLLRDLGRALRLAEEVIASSGLRAASARLLTVQRQQDLYYTPFPFSPFVESSSIIITYQTYSISLLVYVSYGSYAFITKYISLLSIYDPPEASSPEATPSPEDLQPEAFASPAVPAPDLQLQSSPRCRSARADLINPTSDSNPLPL
jgi:hypothetical protein